MGPAAKTVIFSVLVPGSAALWVPLFLMRDRAFASHSSLRVLAASLVVAGVAIYVRCAYDFVKSGRGTPSPDDPPRKLVTRGLFEVVRNPMYVGIVTTLVGWALADPTGKLAAYAGVIALAFHLRVRFYEEPVLERLFGADYRNYCARVNRWWPRWRSSS